MQKHLSGFRNKPSFLTHHRQSVTKSDFVKIRIMKSNDGAKRTKKRKRYEKPTAKQLTPEEGKAKLRRLAEQGDTQAQEMLQIISRREAPQKKKDDDDLKDKKKSA